MELREPLKTPKGDRSSVVGLVQPWELFAKRQLPRIAVNSKGKIFFIEVAEIVAVHSQGNYASVRCRSSLYLLRETLGSIAVKLKPYGFIQIHRSVLVNALLVDEVWPLSTGEYGLRLRNGGEYVVTRRYRDNLKHLAYVWLGSERVFSSARVE
jgi:DNA-binding LytR/AlgR family response regulator